MQHRLDVLLQTGRTNLGERYADAVREFEQRRLEREESLPPPPPTDDETAAWNAAMHAWHDRHAEFGESDLGAPTPGWAMGWGLPASSPLDGDAVPRPNAGSPDSLGVLKGVSPRPSLIEGFRDLK